jgi:transcriptional regulator with XRE-family HTH domain
MTSLSEKVYALRTARRLSQKRLGQLIGVSQSAIAQIENGNTVTLSGKVLAGLCQHLHVVPQFLVGETGNGVDGGVLEAEALFLFRSMDESRQRAAVLMLRGLADAPPTQAAVEARPTISRTKRPA